MGRAFLLFFVSLSSYASSYWITGDDYVAWYEPASGLKAQSQVYVDSAAVDRAACRLWTADSQKKKVRRFEAGLESELSVLPYQEILGDFSEGRLPLRDPKTSRLVIRNAAGEITANVNEGWVSQAEVIRLGKTTWVQRYEPAGQTLTLLTLDDSFKPLNETTLSTGKSVWPNHRIEQFGDVLWVGFSVATPRWAYVPRVDTYSLAGKQKASHTWNDKGLFLDFCQRGETVLVARDAPQGTFTVPVYSYLEQLGTKKPVYEAEVNFLIDGIACEANEVLMVQHSILGSSQSFLVSWKNGVAKPVAKLPGKPQRLYRCD